MFKMTTMKHCSLCFFLLASACQQEEASWSRSGSGDSLAGGSGRPGIGTSTSSMGLLPLHSNALRSGPVGSDGKIARDAHTRGSGTKERDAGVDQADNILPALSQGFDSNIFFPITLIEGLRNQKPAAVKDFQNRFATCAVTSSLVNSLNFAVGDSARAAFVNYADSLTRSPTDEPLQNDPFREVLSESATPVTLALQSPDNQDMVAVTKTVTADNNGYNLTTAYCERGSSGSWTAASVEKILLYVDAIGTAAYNFTSTMYRRSPDGTLSMAAWAATPVDQAGFLAPIQPLQVVSFSPGDIEKFRFTGVYDQNSASMTGGVAYLTSLPDNSSYANFSQIHLSLLPARDGLLSHALSELNSIQLRGPVGNALKCGLSTSPIPTLFKSFFDFASGASDTSAADSSPDSCAKLLDFSKPAYQNQILADMQAALAAGSDLCNRSLITRTAPLSSLALKGSSPPSCHNPDTNPYLSTLIPVSAPPISEVLSTYVD